MTYLVIGDILVQTLPPADLCLAAGALREDLAAVLDLNTST